MPVTENTPQVGGPRTGNEESSGDELKDALNKAADDIEIEEGDESDQDDKSKTATANKSKVEDKKPEEDDEEDEVDEAEIRERDNALKFYRSITNPETAEQVLNSIAKRAGYELKSLSTTQRDAMVDEIEHVLRTELGDEFSLLPNNLSKALGKIIDSRVGKTRAELDELKSKVHASEEGLRKAAVDEALAWAAQEYPEFEANNKKILREMKAMPPSPNMNAREYISKICKLADVAPKSLINKERENRARTSREGSTPSDGVRQERSTKTANSLAEAAALAYEEQFPDEK
jgi:hypothetical protein